MRRFEAHDGEEWDVTVGRESWGTFVLLFSRATGGEVRKTTLTSETALDAQNELDGLTEADLRDRLAASQPWGE